MPLVVEAVCLGVLSVTQLVVALCALVRWVVCGDKRREVAVVGIAAAILYLVELVLTSLYAQSYLLFGVEAGWPCGLGIVWVYLMHQLGARRR